MRNFEHFMRTNCNLIKRGTHFLDSNGLNGKAVLIDNLPLTGSVYRIENEQIRLALESASDAFFARNGCITCPIYDRCRPEPKTVQEEGDSWKIFPAIVTAFKRK